MISSKRNINWSHEHDEAGGGHKVPSLNLSAGAIWQILFYFLHLIHYHSKKVMEDKKSLFQEVDRCTK